MDMSPDRISVLGIAGSLRRESYNRALLRAAVRLAPPDATITTFERLHEIPLYNDDVRQRDGLPDPVAELWGRIAAADAVLVACPEYNFGPAGVLKNAVDWVSRPPAESPLRRKPVAIMGASTGLFGTARAQLSLRNTLAYLEAYVVPRPEVAVSRAAERFDVRGELTDDRTRELVVELLRALVDWTRRLSGRAAQ